MTKQEQIKLFNRAYVALDGLNNIKMITKYREELYKQALREEIGHRKYMNDGTMFNMTLQNTARMYVVKTIALFLLKQRTAEIVDYLHTRQSIYYAASIVENYREECEKALDPFDLNELASFDYVSLNKKEKI